MKPIFVEAPFQQWGLDFIGEINTSSSIQHRWILTATNYFTKWIEEIPTRKATDSVIIQFIKENILSRFGCPRKIVIDNAQAFKYKKMINFGDEYNISLNHSTPYYPQGNDLDEYSNKSLVRIIKKLLEDNKKAWHLKLKYALWEDIISTKRSIGTSPFQLIYGTNVVFLASLGVQVIKYLENQEEEPNYVQNRINHLIELKEMRENVYHMSQNFQEKMKNTFDRKIKKDDFHLQDLVLKWDANIEDKGKHGKIDHLWKGPYQIVAYSGKKTYIL